MSVFLLHGWQVYHNLKNVIKKKYGQAARRVHGDPVSTDPLIEVERSVGFGSKRKPKRGPQVLVYFSKVYLRRVVLRVFLRFWSMFPFTNRVFWVPGIFDPQPVGMSSALLEQRRHL